MPNDLLGEKESQRAFCAFLCLFPHGDPPRFAHHARLRPGASDVVQSCQADTPEGAYGSFFSHIYWLRVYSRFVISRDAALAALYANDISRGIVWAYESTCEQALEDFARGTGYTALSAGVGRYDLLADRLDRVFSCGDYEVAAGMEAVGLDVLYEGLTERARTTMPVIKAGTVVRSNLRGSNGWSVAGFRFITHSFPLGELARIDWTQASKTLQAVSRQEPAGSPIPRNLLDMMLDEDQREDLAAQDALPFVGVPTLVLVHSLDRDTAEREIAIGQSRYNDDLGGSWHWREPLSGGPAPEKGARPAPEAPSPAHDEPDVTVRLRPSAAAEDAR